MGKRRDVLGPRNKLYMQDELVGANPETCRHRVLGLKFRANGLPRIVCFSCQSDIDNEFFDRREFKYDEEYDCWVQIGRTRRK